MKILIGGAFHLLICACASSTAAKTRTKQFPFELLGRSPAGFGGQFAALGGIPVNVVSLGFPQDAEMIEGAPVVDGSLRDLLNFGGAMGAMALPHRPNAAGGQLGDALELPLDALHVQMQHVPAPLRVDDSHGKVRIYGTLPKNLTSKSLKVSLSGDDDRSVLVKYFLGQDGDSKSVVGIDEHFSLDFTPADAPAVKYKASTGAFELLLTRPAVKQNQDVSIDFDTAPATDVKPNNLRKVIAADKKVKAAGKVVPVRHQPEVGTHQKQVSAKESDRSSNLKPVQPRDLTKVIQELNKAARPSQTDKDRVARAMEVANRAKHFVSDVHLSDAKKELADAFAPLDAGLVMLEMRHQVRAH